jgi:hypothetical protein
MAIYRVWVCLEAEYDDIEADSEDEAFVIASDAAMGGGSWQYTVEKVEDDDEGNA